VWGNPSQQLTANTTARAVPPGEWRSWLYITSGRYAGYWRKQADGVHLEP
jgi:phage terminase large subunit-like protein